MIAPQLVKSTTYTNKPVEKSHPNPSVAHSPASRLDDHGWNHRQTPVAGSPTARSNARMDLADLRVLYERIVCMIAQRSNSMLNDVE